MKRQLPRFLRYDPSLGRIATPQGELSLKRLFLPLFLESLLLNLMGTVNTYVLSFYADESVAAVGSANQLIGLSLLVFLFGGHLLRLFTDDAQILHTGWLLLAADIAVEAFRAVNHIEENALRGAGDVFFPMVASIVSCWCASVLLAYLFSIRLGMGLLGCWLAFACDEGLRGIVYLTRWHSRRWEKKLLQ